MMQIDQHHHHHQHHYQQQQQQQQNHYQQPLRQEYHGNSSTLPPPPNYYYLHGNTSNNSTGHHSDALATSSNMYSMQQEEQHHHQYRMSHEQQPQPQQHAAHLAFSGPAAPVPMTHSIYHHDESHTTNNSQQQFDENMGVATSNLAERDQFPSNEEFESIVQGYLDNLSSKKRDKALIDRHRYSLIIRVLKDPRNTAISTAQFRFWVKKMFQLVPLYSGIEVVCHDNKPVAMREEIYAILVRAHKEANHGGRDKTSALVRRRYSWIPKELIARFVRYCPFCISRRNGSSSPPLGLLPRTPPDYALPSTSARGNNCSTQPPPMTGLPYLPMELKPASNEDDDLSITNKNDNVWPGSDRNQHHQQQYFTSPTQQPIGTTVSPVSTPVSGPVSVDFGITSNTTATSSAMPSSSAPVQQQPVSSCSGISPVSFDTPNTFYHQPTLLSQCNITSLDYSTTATTTDSSDVSVNEHVNHPPSYNTMCYTTATSAADDSENVLPIATTTTTAPPQQDQRRCSNNTSSNITTESYYYAPSHCHQQKQQNEIIFNTSSHDNHPTITTLQRPRVSRDTTGMIHYPLYALSSPSPSSSFSSSSSSSASSTSSPISPTHTTATTPPFNTTTTSSSLNNNNYPQSMYMQHPPPSSTTTSSNNTTIEFINQTHHQRQQF